MGLKLCWIRDKFKTDVAVQKSVNRGYPNSRTWHRATPTWAKKYLVYLGNEHNDDATVHTFVQVVRCTPDTEAA